MPAPLTTGYHNVSIGRLQCSSGSRPLLTGRSVTAQTTAKPTVKPTTRLKLPRGVCYNLNSFCWNLLTVIRAAEFPSCSEHPAASPYFPVCVCCGGAGRGFKLCLHRQLIGKSQLCLTSHQMGAGGAVPRCVCVATGDTSRFITLPPTPLLFQLSTSFNPPFPHC